MSLASLEEFEKRIYGGISSGDEERAQAALDDASALILAEGNALWIGEDESPGDDAVPVPAAVAAICIAVAKRAFLNPEGVSSESIDGYRASFQAGEVSLTKEEKRIIRKGSGKSGLWTQPTTRSVDDIPDVPSVLTDADTASPITAGDPFTDGWT